MANFVETPTGLWQTVLRSRDDLGDRPQIVVQQDVVIRRGLTWEDFLQQEDDDG